MTAPLLLRPVNALSRAFVDLVLNGIPVFFGNDCSVQILTVVVRFREVVLIHLKISGQVRGAGVARRAIVLLYRYDTFGHTGTEKNPDRCGDQENYPEPGPLYRS